MGLFRAFTVCLLLALLPLPLHGAPKPRPFSGSALLIIRPFPAEAGTVRLRLYEEPGVGRMAELEPGKLPGLEPVVIAPAGEYAVAVVARRGEWLRLAYDEAGREGWVRMERSWLYLPWESFLEGRTARFLPGLKHYCHLLRREDSDSAPVAGTVPRESGFMVVRVRGEWAQVVAPAVRGWLRWRDEDGRFLIAVDGA